MDTGSNTQCALTEVGKLQKWHSEEKGKGLVDIKFLRISTENATIESFCEEVNRALAAPLANDSGLF